MQENENQKLSNREFEIMEILYRIGNASIQEIGEQLPDKSGKSSLSKLLWLMEEKGFVTHNKVGKRNIYSPALKPEEASQNLMDKVMKTFFQGSASLAVSAFLKNSEKDLSVSEIDDLYQIIKNFREKQ